MVATRHERHEREVREWGTRRRPSVIPVSLPAMPANIGQGIPTAQRRAGHTLRLYQALATQYTQPLVKCVGRETCENCQIVEAQPRMGSQLLQIGRAHV